MKPEKGSRLRYSALILIGGIALGLQLATVRAQSAADDPYQLGVKAFERGSPAEALPCFLKARRLRPNDARVANALGNTWFALSQPSKAQQEYTRAIRLDPRLTAAWKNLGILEFRQGRYIGADRNLSVAVRLSPQDAIAWRFLGFSRQEAGRIPQAATALHRSLQLDPHDAQTRLALAEAEVQVGSPEAAVADYRLLLRSAALDPNKEKKVGMALLSLDDPQDAAEQLGFVLAQNPRQPDVELALAQAQAAAHQFEQARQTIHEVLPNAKDKPRLEAMLGWVEQQDHHPTEAAAAYRDAVLANPKWPEPYLQLSWLYAEHRHFDEAATTLREGLRFVSDPESLRLQLGTILVLGGHEHDAIPILQEVIAAQPHNPAGYTTLIINYTLLEPSYDRPLQVAEKALKECPGDYLVHYLYAGLLFRENRQNLSQPGSEALAEKIRLELTKSVRLNPGFPHSHYDLARLEFETNHYPSAEREALAALHADSDFTEARYLLGRVYIKEGRKKDGEAEISKVAEQHIDEIHHVELVGQALLATQAAATASGGPVRSLPGETVSSEALK